MIRIPKSSPVVREHLLRAALDIELVSRQFPVALETAEDDIADIRYESRGNIASD